MFTYSPLGQTVPNIRRLGPLITSGIQMDDRSSIVERASSGGWGAGARTEIDLRSPHDIYNILHNQGEIVHLQQVWMLISEIPTFAMRSVASNAVGEYEWSAETPFMFPKQTA
jgi:hypothetical protein